VRASLGPRERVKELGRLRDSAEVLVHRRGGNGGQWRACARGENWEPFHKLVSARGGVRASPRSKGGRVKGEHAAGEALSTSPADGSVGSPTGVLAGAGAWRRASLGCSGHGSQMMVPASCERPTGKAGGLDVDAPCGGAA
jgi:hypothetical protein